MLITNYYQFRKLPTTKSKTRFDCVASSKDYKPFEKLRNKKGQLFIYYTPIPKNFNTYAQSKFENNITNSKGKNLSSVFMPDKNILIAYGDVFKTSDGILIVFNTDCSLIELFVLKGTKQQIKKHYDQLIAKEFNNEIELLRKQAKIEITSNK